MARAFLRALLSFIGSVVGILIAPIDLLVSTMFPNINNWINDWNMVSTRTFSYINNYIGYFISFVPPYTRTAMTIFLGVLVITFTATLSIHLILKAFRIIHNIKFW